VLRQARPVLARGRPLGTAVPRRRHRQLRRALAARRGKASSRPAAVVSRARARLRPKAPQRPRRSPHQPLRRRPRRPLPRTTPSRLSSPTTWWTRTFHTPRSVIYNWSSVRLKACRPQ
jgi:hypothetical protein